MLTATTASALEWKWKLKCIDFPGQVISWAKIRNLKTKRLPGPRGTVLLGYRSWWSRSRIPSASYKECRNSFFIYITYRNSLCSSAQVTLGEHIWLLLSCCACAICMLPQAVFFFLGPVQFKRKKFLRWNLTNLKY